MYSSGLGRWLSPDPLAGDITNPQSLNRYAYVLNNPCNFLDPFGLGKCGQLPTSPGYFGVGESQLRPGRGGDPHFGAPRGTNENGEARFHQGLDIAAANATPLYPLLNGTVSEVKVDASGFGLEVIVNAGAGYSYRLAHLQAAFVSKGQRLSADTLIGFAGSTGNASGLPAGEEHVHLQIEKGGVPRDPFTFMNSDCPKGLRNQGEGSEGVGGTGHRGGLPFDVAPPGGAAGIGVDMQEWLEMVSASYGLIGEITITHEVVTATIGPASPLAP